MSPRSYEVLDVFTNAPLEGNPVGRKRGLDRVLLRTGAGVVAVALRRDGDAVVYGEMEQPLPTWSELAQADALLAALGVERSELPVEVYDNGPRHTFVALSSEAEVAVLRPDLGALADVGTFGVSCFAASRTRVKTRMFGPALGIAEDPATGSAAGPLAVHLARHGAVAFGDWIEIRQGEEIGRPSVLRAVAEGSGDALERVIVGGGVLTVAAGSYRV